MKHALSMDNSSSLPPAKKAMKWVDDSSDDGASEVSNESHGLSSGDDVSLFQVSDCASSSSAINAPGSSSVDTSDADSDTEAQPVEAVGKKIGDHLVIFDRVARLLLAREEGNFAQWYGIGLRQWQLEPAEILYWAIGDANFHYGGCSKVRLDHAGLFFELDRLHPGECCGHERKYSNLVSEMLDGDQN